MEGRYLGYSRPEGEAPRNYVPWGRKAMKVDFHYVYYCSSLGSIAKQTLSRQTPSHEGVVAAALLYETSG